MDLTHAIAEAAAHFDSPPPNEAATCLWVIDPLLLALGYARKEIRPQGSDSSGQFPDYTILPDTPCAWYLEVKAWNVALQDGHAHQALNYANQNGRRWVVLCNGRTWRLYDNQIQGLAADKIVVEANLEDLAGAERLLAALSRNSVSTGALEQYATESRLSVLLRAELRDPNSRIVKDLWRSLKARPGLATVTCTELAACFTGLLLQPAPPTGPRLVPKPMLPGDPPIANGAGTELDALAANGAEYFSGKKPEALICPDGSRKVVDSWVDLAHEAVQWLGRQRRLPSLPFHGFGPASRYFLNSEPRHQKRPMKRSRQLRFGDRLVYMDTDRGGEHFTNLMRAACEAVGEAPAEFLVVLKE